MMNRLIKYLGSLGCLALLLGLYQIQLGAISFFLMAIFFFYLAYKQLNVSSRKIRETDGESHVQKFKKKSNKS